jgi:hypothetical protein
MSTRPYTAADVAALLGVTRDTFYRREADYIAAGMPAPISPVGHKRYNRARFDGWYAGRDGAPAARPANDDGVTNWRVALAEAYAPR